MLGMMVLGKTVLNKTRKLMSESSVYNIHRTNIRETNIHTKLKSESSVYNIHRTNIRETNIHTKRNKP